MIDPQTMTVLICDDMITMCRSIHKMMKVIGFGKAFHYAHNGKEALSALRKKGIDLLLMDYNMPVMNGGETLAQIREDRLLRDLPVLMISANASTEYVAEVAETDIDGFIAKPLTVKVLEQKLTLVVDNANNPPPVTKHLKNARDCEEDDDLPGAIRDARLAVEAAPHSSKPLRELGYYYLKNGAPESAEKMLLKAAKMNDLDVVAFHQLGEFYIEKKDYEKAQYYLEKAMKISPRHLARGFQFGKTLIQLQENKKAVEVFDSIIKLSDDSQKTKEQIAELCLGTGTSAYAAELFESILANNPKRKELFHKIGMAWKVAGRTSEALSNLGKAEQHDPEDIGIKIDLAKSFIDLEKPILAERALKRALRIDPEHNQAQKLMKDCIAMDAP
jgi:CheY-like chemotaxis protein